MHRIALISDIHGNAAALDVVLADLDALAPDAVVCLGDVAATGPAPRDVIARLRPRGWPIVRGNTDDTLLRMVAGDEPPSDEPHEAIDRWCAEQLLPDDVAFLTGFQPVVRLEVEGTAICCYHGSPHSNVDVVEPGTETQQIDRWFHGHQGVVFAGGHTHIQMIRRYKESFLINPGSVGLPFTVTADGSIAGPAWAEYGVVTIDGPRVAVELRRIPVDRQRALALAAEREMPHQTWWSGGAE
jgi:putative phosphoesterase